MEEEYIERENNHNHRLKKNNNGPKAKIKLNSVCDLIKIPINQLNSIDVNILTGKLYKKIYEEALEEEKNRLQNNFEEKNGNTSKKKKMSNKNGVQKTKNNDRNRDEDYYNNRKNNNSVQFRKKKYNEVSSSSSENEEERKDMSDIRRVKSRNSLLSQSNKNNDQFLLSNSYNNLNLNFYRNNFDNFNTYNNYDNNNSKSNNKKNNIYNYNNNYNDNSNYNYNNMTSYNNNDKYTDQYKEKNNKNNFAKHNNEYIVNGEQSYKNSNSSKITYNQNTDNNYDFSNSSDSLPKHFYSSNINLRNNLSLAYPLKKIVFVIKYNSSFGEEVGILGSLQILGNWEQKRVFKLKWNSGHIWKGEIFVTNDSVKDFEFKFVILQDNKVKNWENGSNNKFNYDILFNQIRVKRKGFYSKYDYDYNIYNGELVLNCKWSC